MTLPPGTSHARIVGSGLSAIELRANAPLRVLDLRECAEGLHFTFEAEGPLERVILPPGRGACLVVRLASAEVGTVFEGGFAYRPQSVMLLAMADCGVEIA